MLVIPKWYEPGHKFLEIASTENIICNGIGELNLVKSKSVVNVVEEGIRIGMPERQKKIGYGKEKLYMSSI